MISILLKKAYVFLFLSGTALLGQEQVFVEAASEGQGMVRAKGKDCYVITPYHVVQQTAGDFHVIGPHKSVSTVVIEQKYETSDLAILKVTGGQIFCEKWLELENFDIMLKTQSGGHIVIREIDGSTSPIPVKFLNIGNEFLTVQAVDPNDGFREGMSGSTLLLNGATAGMLMSVDVKTQTGTILRRDVIQRLTDAFFKIPVKQKDFSEIEKDQIAESFKKRMTFNILGFGFFNTFLFGSENVQKIFFGQEAHELFNELNIKSLNSFMEENKITFYTYPLDPAKKVYYQLRFTDGTSSEIKVIENDPRNQHKSLQISAVNNKGKAPVLLFIYDPNYASDLRWSVPLNATKSYFTLDEGGFFEKGLMDNSSRWEPGQKYLKLKFTLKNGEEFGPFEYNLSSIPDFLRTAAKPIFEKKFPEAFTCTRNKQKGGEITCSVTSRKQLLSFISVKEFRFGHSPENLQYTVVMDLPPEQFTNSEVFSALIEKMNSHKFPNLNDQFYGQVLYIDGSTSDVMRLKLY